MNDRVKQIVAMGGGGFSMEPENPLLDRYILNLTQSETPKVLFLPTASGDRDRYIVRFYSAFLKFPCIPSHLSLFNAPLADLRSLIFAQDILYVGGGSTKNLIALWKAWELDQILREAWERGIVLCGLSAGSLCWFESGVSDYLNNGEMAVLQCLGFLPGSHCPHYDGEATRRPAYHQFVEQSRLPAGYAADDGVGLHFIGDQLSAIVSSRPDAKAYRVKKIGDSVHETPLQPRYLGDSSIQK
ncbi:peptidase E [Leptolyngbya sp. NIES-2104]|nr:peptidase E [Leptolyngbya sp. NIES-2104]